MRSQNLLKYKLGKHYLKLADVMFTSATLLSNFTFVQDPQKELDVLVKVPKPTTTQKYIMRELINSTTRVYITNYC